MMRNRNLLSPSQSSGGPDGDDTHIFRLHGEFWTVRYEGKVFHLRDSKGLRYLARLLRSPEERFSTLDLLAEGTTDRPTSPQIDPLQSERARSAVTKRIRATMAKIEAFSPSLAHHLRSSVRTGQFCVYEPDPAHPFQWIG